MPDAPRPPEFGVYLGYHLVRPIARWLERKVRFEKTPRWSETVLSELVSEFKVLPSRGIGFDFNGLGSDFGTVNSAFPAL
jgi:hypothetical protein